MHDDPAIRWLLRPCDLRRGALRAAVAACAVSWIMRLIRPEGAASAVATLVCAVLVPAALESRLSGCGAAGALVGGGGQTLGLWMVDQPGGRLVASVGGAALGTLTPLMLMLATFGVLVWWAIVDGLEELGFPRGEEPAA